MTFAADAPRWIGRLASVEGRLARLALWREAFGALAPPEAAARLDGVVRAAALHRPAAVVAYLPLLDLPTLVEGGLAGALAGTLTAAREADLTGALLVLEHPGTGRFRRVTADPPDPLLDAISLGRRKTLARGPRTPLLDRVRTDSDPRVVVEVLRNPRLTEDEVVTIAARRPSPHAVARLLARADGWIRRPAVQRALAWNPYTPPQLAVGLTVLLPTHGLRELTREKGLHPAVAEGALEVLGWRGEAG